MKYSLKIGAAAIAALFGSGLVYLSAADTPAFAQATAGQTTGTAAQPTTERRTRRPTVVRPATGVRVPPGGTGGQVGPGVGPGPGSVALTAAECTALGGTISYSAEICSSSTPGLSGLVCRTGAANTPDRRISCINEVSR